MFRITNQTLPRRHRSWFGWFLAWIQLVVDSLVLSHQPLGCCFLAITLPSSKKVTRSVYTFGFVGCNSENFLHRLIPFFQFFPQPMDFGGENPYSHIIASPTRTGVFIGSPYRRFHFRRACSFWFSHW